MRTGLPDEAGDRRFTMPACEYTPEEAEAVVVGLRWVFERGGEALSEAARVALRRFMAGVPAIIAQGLEDASLLAEPEEMVCAGDIDIATLRRAVALQEKLTLLYTDAEDNISRRTVCPLAVGQFLMSRAILAFCELRRDFRHFRTDRIRNILPAEGAFDRDALLAEWMRRTGGEDFIPEALSAQPSSAG